MAHINQEAKEVGIKLVYYGPQSVGKSSNLRYVHSQLAPELKGDLTSLSNETESILFFDFSPVNLDTKTGFRTRFYPHTVPTQGDYGASCKGVLNGVDGVVFVADSNFDRAKDNFIALTEMIENLAEYNLTIDQIPWVIQYNKRDLPNAMSAEQMEKELNIRVVPSFEAVATQGEGVFDTFKAIVKLVMDRLA